jgi:CelD/BcsL family acetyltransferase involved in cellulose biosynthesis
MITLNLTQNFDFTSQEAQEFYASAYFKPYQSALWLSLIGQTLTQNKDCFTVIFKSDEKIIALLPLLREREKSLTLIKMLDCGVSDENDILVLPEFIDIIKRDKLLFTRLIVLLKPFDMVVIDKTTASNTLIFEIFPQFKKHYYRFSTHKLALNLPFEALREAKYNGTHRRTLDKKAGKLSRKGHLRLEEVHEESEIKATFEDFLKFRAFRFQGQNTDVTQDPLYQAFYLKFCKQGIAQGVARMMRLRLDDITLGVTIGLTFDNSYQIVMLGFDREAYANWSPGLILVDKIIEDGVKRGENYVDLTIGDEPYKYLFGVESERVSSLYYTKTLKGKAYALARFKGALIKRWFLAKRAAWLKRADSSSQKESPKQEAARA